MSGYLPGAGCYAVVETLRLRHNVATVSSRWIEMVGYNLERNDQTVSASSSVYLGGGLVVVFVYLTS